MGFAHAKKEEGREPESLIGEGRGGGGGEARPLSHAGVAGLGWEFIRRKGGGGSQTSGFARLHGRTHSR